MTHEQYVTYFEDIARSHYLILHESSGRKSFYKANIEELLEGLPSKSMAYPCMILESFEGRITNQSGNRDNNLDEITGAFTILYKVKQADYDNENTRLDAARQIGFDVVGKLLNDLYTRAAWPDGQLKFISFNPNTVRYFKVGPLNDNEFGYRFEFVLVDALKNNISFDLAKWV